MRDAIPFHAPVLPDERRCGPLRHPDAPMTTSAQQTVLTAQELESLRQFASGTGDCDRTQLAALAAKGMIDDADAASPALTPAGHHALHVGSPGSVPGIDT